MRILVTGASGLLGSNIALAAVDAGHEVIASSHTRPLHHPAIEWVVADLELTEQAETLISDARPEAIIHCAAATNVDVCEADPQLADRLNRDLAAQVARAARQIGAVLVHMSTDAVFDGEGGPYDEQVEPNPLNAYARSKLDGERAVLSVNPSAAVIRTNFYGWSPPGRKSLAEWFLEELRAGRECGGFTDVLVSPLLANDLAEYLLRVCSSDLRGTYHLGSTDCISKYEFGVRLAVAFDLDPTLIRPTEVSDAGLRAPRPKQLCLKSDAFRAVLKLKLREIAAGIERLKRLEADGYPWRLAELVPATTVVE
jgi:dTDP-4-dehydrorhamnose reductase